MTKKICFLLLLSSALTALSQTPVYPTGGGGGTGCVPGSTSNILKGNNAGGCVAASPGTDVLTATGQFPSSNLVSAVTSGLVAEYHFQEASGATTITDFSTAGNNATVTGTIGLTGTLAGGMNVCSTGCVGNVAPSGYASLPAGLNTTALTMQVYTCQNALTASGITGGFFDEVITGLVSATTPSGSNTQAFGLFLNGNQGNSLSGGVVAKYATAPSIINNTAITAQSIEAVGGCHLITWTRNSGSPDLFYVDGHATTGYQFTGTAGTAAVSPTGSFALGSAPYATLNATYKHPYPIYFFNAYSRVLTAAEIQTNYGVIQSSMQFRGVAPPTPVYTDAGNQIIAGIDSLTYGFNSASVKGWPFYTSSNSLSGAVVLPAGIYPQTATNNIATVGWQLEQAVTECPTRGYTSINPNSSTTVIMWGGTNDLMGNVSTTTGLASATPAVVYQRLRRLVQCWKGATPQPRVFVMTMISRTGTSTGNAGATMDSLKNQYNDLIRKDYAGADGLIDLASFASLGADGAYVGGGTACGGSACFSATGDHVHLTDAGQQQVASLVSAYVNLADAKTSGTNPALQTGTAYQETSGDIALNVNPSSASQTITLPTAVGIVGTDRYIYNVQATGSNTVTIAAASGENIDNNATVTCSNSTKCVFRSVLGATPGTTTADSAAGAHWEQLVLAAGGGGSGNATSIQSVPVDPTAPTSSQVLGYNGTSWIPTTVAGGTVPTGTGFYHITSGVADGAAQAVPTATTSVLGLVKPDGTTITISGGTISSTGGGSVPTGTGFVHVTSGAQDPAAAALPVGSTSTQGIVNCDGTTISCTSGLLVALGGAGNATSLQGVAINATAPTTNQVLAYNGTAWIPTAAAGGGASLAANTFTGQQTMPSLLDTPVADTGAVNVAVVANTSITALTSGEIIAWNPIAANTIATPTLNVNSLGAKNITRFGNVAVAAGDLVIGTTAVVIYNSAGSGTWQLLNPATAATTVSPTFTGTTTLSGTAANFTVGAIQKSGQGVHFTNQCTMTIAAAATTGTCAITGGAAGNLCTWAASNATARALINNTTTAIAITASGNIPSISMSGANATLTFATGGSGTFINTPVGTETFNVVCPI